MTSAYGGGASASPAQVEAVRSKCKYLPIRSTLVDGTPIVVDLMAPSDEAHVMQLLNDVINDGGAWPFETRLTEAEFRAYWCSGAALVVRVESVVVGAFYVKQNFPGRSAHYANGGFITDKSYRRRGVGKVMGEVYLRVARDLGYRAAMFNLVYATNVASVRLWEKLGFVRVGRLPGVGRLKGHDDFVDADVMYYDLIGEAKPHQHQYNNSAATSVVACACGVCFALGIALGLAFAVRKGR